MEYLVFRDNSASKYSIFILALKRKFQCVRKYKKAWENKCHDITNFDMENMWMEIEEEGKVNVIIHLLS